MDMIKNKLLRAAIILLLLMQGFSELFAQPANDNCASATVIDTFASDQEFLCFQGTTLGASPEAFPNSCYLDEFPTVWFQITVDSNASLMRSEEHTSELQSQSNLVCRLLL